ncbi:MAG: sugar phosphate isomerase/epimerase family protein [Planctomycetota bacterium]|jgi:sugar phosphate isomerase/epimerase
MRPAVWSSYFMDLSPEDMVRRFAEKGWAESELSTEHGETLLGRGDPSRSGAEFRRFASDEGMSFPQGHLWLVCDIAPSGGEAEQDGTVDRLREWLDLFMAVGVEAAVLHPGGWAPAKGEEGRAKVLDARARALRALTEHASGALTIALENCGDTAADLMSTIDHAGCGGLGICLDTGHAHLAKLDQAEFIARAGERLVATHLADNDGSGDQHLMPYGRGTVAWEDVMRALGGWGYAGLLNLEIPGERRCPIEVRLAKLDYLKGTMEYLIDIARRA